MAVIMTSEQFIERLKVLAARRTYYKNKYPDNLCYIHADGRTSADCVNLVKALLNGYDVNNNMIGYYQRDLSNTGDCTEKGLIDQCSGVSNDFKSIKAPAILYMKGRIRTYIGITPDNRFNVIECTTSFGGGIVYSWVDQDGTRRSENGGKPIILSNGTYQRWEKYGYPTKWVSYGSVQSEPPKTEINRPMLKKGSKGRDVDLLKALLIQKGYIPYSDVFDDSTLKAVKLYQEQHTDASGKRLEVDGIVGPKTWESLLK